MNQVGLTGALERQLDGLGSRDLVALQVVREFAGDVEGDVLLVRLEQVDPERHVSGRHGGSVGPIPFAQTDVDDGVVVRIGRSLGQAQPGIDHWLALVADPEQRPVRQPLKFLDVRNAVVGAGEQRQDVVGI